MTVTLVVLRPTFQKRGGIVGGCACCASFLNCISGHFANFQKQRIPKNDKTTKLPCQENEEIRLTEVKIVQKTPI